MVLGEEQILSQVKDAGVSARKSRSSRGNLSSVFDASVSVGKRVRTALKQSGAYSSEDESVSSMALRFALERLPAAPQSVLLIGTGKTTRLAASQLAGAKLYVATKRASVTAFPRATLVSHRNLRRVAAKCDLIISATKHPGYLLKEGDLGRKTQVILDLAFPRNIDPKLNQARPGSTTLTTSPRVSASRPTSLTPQALRAAELVSAEAESFSRWLLASRQSSALSQVYRWAEDTRNGRDDAALRRLPNLSQRGQKGRRGDEQEAGEQAARAPHKLRKVSSPELPQDQRLDVIQRVFDQGEK